MTPGGPRLGRDLGALIDADPPLPRELTSEEWAALDDLDEPAPSVHSIARLLALKRASGDLERWKRNIAAIPTHDTQTLVLRISTTTDPLTAWALHVHLDKRGIAPALRWPANTQSDQLTFITWLADILWLSKRNPSHIAKFQSWQRLLRDVPGTPTWCEAGWWIFTVMYKRQNVSSYTARGLALSPTQRQELMMLPTSRMAGARLELTGDRWAETRHVLLTHAMANPDKSGTHKPQDIANRRARLWQTFVLSGRSPTATTQAWKLLTDESVSRQVLTRQIDTILTALKSEL